MLPRQCYEFRCKIDTYRRSATTNGRFHSGARSDERIQYNITRISK